MLLDSKRCTLDLPGFKNLEGLYLACFSPNDSPQTLVYKDERSDVIARHALLAELSINETNAHGVSANQLCRLYSGASA